MQTRKMGNVPYLSFPSSWIACLPFDVGELFQSSRIWQIGPFVVHTATPENGSTTVRAKGKHPSVWLWVYELHTRRKSEFQEKNFRFCATWSFPEAQKPTHFASLHMLSSSAPRPFVQAGQPSGAQSRCPALECAEQMTKRRFCCVVPSAQRHALWQVVPVPHTPTPINLNDSQPPAICRAASYLNSQFSSSAGSVLR